MDQTVKKIADKIADALKTNKSINEHYNKLMDYEARNTIASLFIESIDTQDQKLNLEKELEKTYNELWDFIVKKQYRTDILFLVLTQLRINIIDDNATLKEVSDYIKSKVYD